MLKGKRALLVLPLILVLLIFELSLAQHPKRVERWSGSGFVVSSNGYVLTNKHVVQGATSLFVNTKGKRYQAKVVKVHPSDDLALIKIEAADLPTLRLGNSDRVRKGDKVIAFGYPLQQFGEGISVTKGIINSMRSSAPFREEKTTFEISATLNHGNSGGPLLNSKGEVIGVNYAAVRYFPKAEKFAETNFAIPINYATPLLELVPGFKPSDMGQATLKLTLQEVIDRVSPAVVYIEAKKERSLRDFLPREKDLGFDVTQAEEVSYLPIGPEMFYSPFWTGSRRPKVPPVESAFQVTGKPSDNISVVAGVYDYANSTEANRVADMLADPERFDMPLNCVHRKHRKPCTFGCVYETPSQTRYEHICTCGRFTLLKHEQIENQGSLTSMAVYFGFSCTVNWSPGPHFVPFRCSKKVYEKRGCLFRPGSVPGLSAVISWAMDDLVFKVKVTRYNTKKGEIKNQVPDLVDMLLSITKITISKAVED